MPERSSSAAIRPKRSATTSPDPTMSCRRLGARGMHPGLVFSIFSSAARSSAAMRRALRRSVLPRSVSPGRKVSMRMPCRCRPGSAAAPRVEPAEMGDPSSHWRIAKITLDEHTVVRRNADIEHERAVAIFDLLEENSFAPTSGVAGPFHVHLAIEEGRVILDIRSTEDAPLERIALPLAPLRSIVKDYFMICESYYAA